MPISIVQGSTSACVVQAKNAEGQVVGDTGITVVSDNTAVATATVNPDGSNGVATAAAGATAGQSCNFTATDAGGIVSPMDVVTITADTKVASLVIVP